MTNDLVTANHPLAETGERGDTQPNRAGFELAVRQIVLIASARLLGKMREQRRPSDLLHHERQEISETLSTGGNRRWGRSFFDPEKVAKLIEQGGQAHRLPPRVRHALRRSMGLGDPWINREWRRHDATGASGTGRVLSCEGLMCLMMFFGSGTGSKVLSRCEPQDGSSQAPDKVSVGAGAASREGAGVALSCFARLNPKRRRRLAWVSHVTDEGVRNPRRGVSDDHQSRSREGDRSITGCHRSGGLRGVPQAISRRNLRPHSPRQRLASVSQQTRALSSARFDGV